MLVLLLLVLGIAQAETYNVNIYSEKPLDPPYQLSCYNPNNNATNGCYAPLDLQYLPSGVTLSFSFRNYDTLSLGKLIKSASLVIKAAFCVPSQVDNSTVRLVYQFWNQPVEGVYYIETNQTLCTDFNTYTIPFPDFGSTWWLWFNYKENPLSFMITAENDDGVVMYASSIDISFETEKVVPDITLPKPLFPYECDEVTTIEAYLDSYIDSVNYTCDYKGLRLPGVFFPETKLIKCPRPEWQLIFPPSLGKASAIEFAVLPNLPTKLNFISKGLMFYVLPKLISITPTYGNFSGGMVSIYGEGFFETDNITIFVNDVPIKRKDLDISNLPYIEFTIIPSSITDRNNTVDIRVSMDGIYMTRDVLKYTYTNYTDVTPEPDPYIPDACYSCINPSAQKKGWCYYNDTVNTCLDGDEFGPLDSNECQGGVWYFYYCPADTYNIPISLIQEVKYPSEEPAEFCRNMCILSYQNYSVYDVKLSSLSFYFDKSILDGTMVNSIDIETKSAFCGYDHTSPSQSATYTFDLDNIQPRASINIIPPKSACGNDTLFDVLTHHCAYEIDANSRMHLFDYTSNHTLTFTVNQNVPIYKRTSIAIVKLLLTANVIDVDPIIKSVSPNIMDYNTLQNTDGFSVKGYNFHNFRYTCFFTSDEGTVFSETAVVQGIYSYTCPIPKEIKSISPKLGLPINYNLTMRSQDVTSTYRMESLQIQIYSPPELISLEPNSGNSGDAVTLTTKGVYSCNRLSVFVDNDAVSNKTFTCNPRPDGTQVVIFRMPNAAGGSTKCVKISIDGTLKYPSNCFTNFTYLRTDEPQPISPPQINPQPIPIHPPQAVPQIPPQTPPQILVPQPDSSKAPVVDPFIKFLTDQWYVLLATVLGVFFVVLLSCFLYFKVTNKSIAYTRLDEFDRAIVERAQISKNELTFKEILGVGSFASVYRGYWKKTEVAIKIVRPKKGSNIHQELMEEATIMVRLRHPNIVAFMGACTNPDLFIVTEYLSRGSLYDVINDESLIIEKEHVRKFALDTCKGMHYLHSFNIIHRDLKTQNLLLDQNWTVKVADFGLSRVIEDANNAQTLTACGTPTSAAPEVLRDQRYSLKADVYSFGMCLWETITRKEPYPNMQAAQVVIAVAIKGKRMEIPEDVPKEFADLITKCWGKDPDPRPNFSQIVEILESFQFEEPLHPHPYSEEPIIIDDRKKKRVSNLEPLV